MNGPARRLVGLALLGAAPALAQVTSIGLSSVRAQRFDGFVSPELPLQERDHFGFAFAIGDFDGNGAADLATGVPHDDGAAGAEVEDSGFVLVRRSLVGTGLSTMIQIARQVGDGAESGDVHGYALASCDFDGDDFGDLAVGAPGEAIGTLDDAGAVFIYYGTSSGLATEVFSLLTQDTPGIPDAAESDDLFGFALACGDFDADGFYDLIVGSPGEDAGILEGAGLATVIPGSANGLNPSASAAFTHLQVPIDQNSRLGAALATGDWNDDGFDDLAVGEPGEDDSRGAVQIRFGSGAGLNLGSGLRRTESEIGGLSEIGDNFAYALAGGDFDGDGHDDLAIGIPGEDFGVGGTIPNCGLANVLYGGDGGFDFGRTQFWSQDNMLGAGTSEAFDLVGLSLAAGDFDDDGRDDLVVGSPGEFVTGVEDGAATVIMGSPGGLTAARHRGLAAGFAGFPGNAAEHGRQLTYALAAGDLDGDGHDDLVLGAPYENGGGVEDSGAEMVLYGCLFSDGLETGDRSLWTASVPGGIPP